MLRNDERIKRILNTFYDDKQEEEYRLNLILNDINLSSTTTRLSLNDIINKLLLTTHSLIHIKSNNGSNRNFQKKGSITNKVISC